VTSEADFAEDLLGLGVAVPDVEEPPPPPRRPASATELSVLQRALDGAEELQRKGKASPRNRDCARCCALADSEERAGRPRPMVMQVERCRRPDGTPYFAGLCRTCNDIEWSVNQAARFERAKGKGDSAEIERLTLGVMAREKRGRTYHGQRWEGRLAG
jgi:hypothetical protein